MPKYKIYVEWEGSNEVIEDCENEEEAIQYGYDCIADGCANCIVTAELIEVESED